MTQVDSNKTIEVKAKSKDWDKTFQLMSWWKKETVEAAKVMVVGAGALGNEVLKNLTLLNVGHILIVDYDIIEYANLSRSVLYREADCDRKKCDVAAERIREINPNVKVQVIDGNVSADVGLGLFRRMDVIIGCLDNRMARLSLNRSSHKVDKTWIDGGIQDLGGQVQVFKPGVTCYECMLTENDRRFIEAKLSCPDIAAYHASRGSIATTPISSSIIAAIQAQEALKVINGDEKGQMLEEYFYYEGRSNLVLQRKYRKLQPHCPSHFEYDPIISSPLSCKMTVGEALAWLANHFKDDDPYIALDNILVLEITTKRSEITTPLIITKPHLTNEVIKKYQREPGEELVLTKSTQELNKAFPHQNLSLRACGIPALHIIRVLTDDGEKYVELGGDESFLNFQ